MKTALFTYIRGALEASSAHNESESLRLGRHNM